MLVSAWVVFISLRLNGQWSWRLPTLLQVIAPALQVCLVVLVPDSPSWLLSRGKNDESLAILARYHANNEKTDDLVLFEFHQMHKLLAADTKTGTNGVAAVKGPWQTFVETPANRRVLLLVVLVGIYSQWNGNGLISIYFSYALRAVGVLEPSRQVSCRLHMRGPCPGKFL